MPLYRIADDRFAGLARTTFAEAGVTERGLQTFLTERAEVFDPDLLLLAEEFSDWEDSQRRIDLLGVDRDGTLVVIELKRGAGEHMELQALRYAAMVSEMTLDRAGRAFAAGLGPDDEADARQTLLDHLEDPSEEGFAGAVRIVLASETFDAEITTAVLWLNEQGLDLRCVEMTAYADPSGGTLLDVRQVIPLPSEERYRVRERVKRDAVRRERDDLTDEQMRWRRFWSRLIELANERGAVPDLFMQKSGRPKRPNKIGWLSHKTGTVAGIYTLSGFSSDADGVLRPSLIVQGAAEKVPAAFSQVFAAREQIEAAFGGPLEWDPREGRRDCCVFAPPVTVRVEDETGWEELMPAAIESFAKFHAAIVPHLDNADVPADGLGG